MARTATQNGDRRGEALETLDWIESLEDVVYLRGKPAFSIRSQRRSIWRSV